MAKLAEVAIPAVVQKKLAAATLPEALISMIIIMVVFTVAMTIFTKVTLSGTSVSSLLVEGEMNRIMSESIVSRDWEEENFVLDSIQYHKRLPPYLDYEDLYILQVTAKRQQIVVGDIKHIISKN